MGSKSVLALYAEGRLAGVHADFAERWPTRASSWIDVQAWEAAWRTATRRSTRPTVLEGSTSAMTDVKTIISLLRAMDASRTVEGWRSWREHPVPTCAPLGPPCDDRVLLPIRLDAPLQGDRRSVRGTRRRSIPAASRPTDVLAPGATSRAEQAALRAVLLDGRPIALCALCGQELPDSYLTAAHIVRRELLSEQERWDIPWVGVLACKMCDAAFEQGDLFVDPTGIVRARSGRSDGSAGDLGEFLQRADGRPCLDFVPRRTAYFQRHRGHHGHTSYGDGPLH
jgi:hypothetical protein